MKVIVGILAVLVSTVLAGGAGVAVVMNTPDDAIGLIMLATLAATVFVYGPLVLGSMTANWDAKKSEESRRYFRRWYRVMGGLEAVAAVAIIVYGVLAHAPVWLPVVFILGGALLTVVAVIVGAGLQRHEEKHPRVAQPCTAISRQEIANKITKVLVTFVIAFAVLLITLVLVPPVIDELKVDGAVLAACGFAFMVDGIACAIVSRSFSQRLRDSVDRDAARLGQLAKVVLRKKKADLAPADQVAAARYAAMMTTVLPFQFATLTLVYIGLGLQQVLSLVTGSANPFSVFLIVFFAAWLIVFTPLYARQLNRARQYADEHAELLASEGLE